MTTLSPPSPPMPASTKKKIIKLAPRPRKVPVVMKVQPWILAALNVIRDRAKYKVARIEIIEKMLIEGITAEGLSKNSVAVKAELEVILDHEEAKRGK